MPVRKRDINQQIKSVERLHKYHLTAKINNMTDRVCKRSFADSYTRYHRLTFWLLKLENYCDLGGFSCQDFQRWSNKWIYFIKMLSCRLRDTLRIQRLRPFSSIFLWRKYTGRAFNQFIELSCGCASYAVTKILALRRRGEAEGEWGDRESFRQSIY